jgi:hypothetical protein
MIAEPCIQAKGKKEKLQSGENAFGINIVCVCNRDKSFFITIVITAYAQ